jgi:hypothetical protein
MGKILELQKAVYRKILFSHLKNIKNPQLIEHVIESMERIDRDNIIVGLKKTEYGITTDIYLFSSEEHIDILHNSPIPLPLFPWEKFSFTHWNCINYEFDEWGEHTATKIYIDNFAYRLDLNGIFVPVAYFSEYSWLEIPANAVYIDSNQPYIFVDIDNEVKKTIAVKMSKQRNAFYFNNITYESCMGFLEKYFSPEDIDTHMLKKYEPFLKRSREYHIWYDIYKDNWKNRIVNMGFSFQI